MHTQQCPKGIHHLRELIHTNKVTLQLYFSSWAILMAIIVHLLTSYKRLQMPFKLQVTAGTSV